MHVLDVVEGDAHQLLLWLLLDVPGAKPRYRRLPLDASGSIADVAGLNAGLAARLL